MIIFLDCKTSPRVQKLSEDAKFKLSNLEAISKICHNSAISSVLQILNEGGDTKGLRADHPAREYKSVWSKLSKFDGPNGQCLLYDGNKHMLDPTTSTCIGYDATMR